MGTTKLTRKEILAEDPVHGTIIALVDFLGAHKKIISILAIAAVFVAFGIYGGLHFLEKREIQAQQTLARGIDFYHAEIEAEATGNPYENGPTPAFKNESLKYQAASREFSSILSGYGYSKVSIIARYYLGLTQLKLGKKEEAIKNLEMVSNNSKERVVGYLAKRVLARSHQESGNYEEAKKILRNMLADDRYTLPKEDLSLQLSGILIAEGKKEEAVEVLQEANAQGSAFSSFKPKLTAELDRVQKTIQTKPEP